MPWNKFKFRFRFFKNFVILTLTMYLISIQANGEITNLERFISWTITEPSVEFTIISDTPIIINRSEATTKAIISTMSWNDGIRKSNWDVTSGIDGGIHGPVLGIIVNLPFQKPFSDVLLILENIKRRRRKPLYFIFLNKRICKLEIVKEMKSLTPSDLFALDSNVYILFGDEYEPILNQNETSIPFQAYELYCVKNVIIFQRVIIFGGNLNPYLGIAGFLESFTSIAYRRQNYHRTEILGVAQELTFSYLDGDVWIDKESGPPKFVGGYNVEEFRYLRDALNFSEIDVAGKGFIGQGPNGTLLGMGLQLLNGEADISIISSELALYRMKELTFLHPTSEELLLAYFRQLPNSSIRDIYIQPFSLSLWLFSIGAWIILLSSSVSLILVKRKLKCLELKEEEISQENVMWWLGTICQKGWYLFPESVSTRLVMIFGTWMCLILYNSYSAALVSILSYPTVAINTFEDILENKLTIYADTYTINAKAVLASLNASNNLGPSITNTKSNSGESREIDGWAASAIILHTQSAFIAPPYAFYPYARNQNYTADFICRNLASVPVGGPPKLSGMVIKKGSVFKETLNYKLLQLYERGVRNRLFGIYWKRIKLTCLEQSVSHSFDIIDAFSPIILMLSGLVASIIFFSIEILFWAG